MSEADLSMPGTERRQLCTFSVGVLRLGIDALKVQEIVQFQPTTRVPLADDAVNGLMNLRGQIVLILDLRKRLGISADQVRHPVIVVINSGDGAVGLLVDEISEVVDVRQDEYEQPTETLAGPRRQLFKGTYKLPGQLILHLDVEHVACLESSSGPAAGDRNWDELGTY